MASRRLSGSQNESTMTEIEPVQNTVPPEGRRRRSLPTCLMRPGKSNLKVATLGASLHSTWESSTQDPKSVRWDHVQIREYARTVGDNPSCSSGPPLSIDWEYNHPQIMTVDGYESGRPPRKSQYEMILARDKRHSMLLHDWKISQAQISAAIRGNVKTKNQRRRTVNNLGKMTKVEEAIQSVQRKITRLVKFQTSTSRQVQNLNLQSLQAEECRRKVWAEMDSQGMCEDAIVSLSLAPTMPRQLANTTPFSRKNSRREDEGLPPKITRRGRSFDSGDMSVLSRTVIDENEPIDVHAESSEQPALPFTNQRNTNHNKGNLNGYADSVSQPEQQYIQRGSPPRQQYQRPPQQSQQQRMPQPSQQQPQQQQRQPPPSQQHLHQQRRPQPQRYQQQRQPQQRYYQQRPPPSQPQYYQPQYPRQPPPQNYQPQYQHPPQLPQYQHQQMKPPDQDTVQQFDEGDDYVFDEEQQEFVLRT